MIFVDTSFFVALLLPGERHHAAAVSAIETLSHVELPRVLLTTNNVALETITVARYRADHRAAVRAAELLYGGALVQMHRTTQQQEADAIAYLRRHADKAYSAVDCLSFVVMLELGITEALAFDQDFAHRFVVRPGPA